MSKNESTHIKAREDEEGELYVHIDDLICSVKKDIKEVFTTDEEQLAANTLLMTLYYVKKWYHPDAVIPSEFCL